MAKKIEKSSATEMTFFEHLDELRPHIIRALLALIVIAVVAFVFKGFIIDGVLFAPQSPDFVMNRWFCSMGHRSAEWVAWLGGLLGAEWSVDPEVLCMGDNLFTAVNTSVTGQFNLHIKVAMVTGLVLGIPYILWEIWQFVKPALTEGERRGTRLFVLWVSLCFFAGVLFGYFIVTPISLQFFLNYTASENITNLIDVKSYFSLVTGVPLSVGLVFQLPLLVYFLARIGIVSPALLRKYRRHAVVLLAVVSAVITPPDLFSLVLVMLPLYGLYELSILLSGRVWRKYHADRSRSSAS